MADPTPAPAPAPTPTPAPAPGAQVEQLAGGVTRFTPSGDPEEQARVEAAASGVDSPELKEGQVEEAKLPEGYDSWETYGKDVAAGKVKAPEAAPKEGAETPPANPELDAKMAPFTEEFEKNGTLSDESKAKAAEAFNVPVEAVDAYLKGLQSEVTSAQAPFFEQTGGEDGYKQFQEWSVEGMTEAEQAELNEAYTKGGPGALAVQEKFVQRWKAEGNGKPPEDLTRGAKGAGPGSEGDTFRSFNEQRRAQADPRYSTDPDYRKDVEDKIARSANNY